jgi:hypothetical protein
VLRAVLSAALVMAPCLTLAETTAPPDPRALLSPGAECVSPWLRASSPPPGEGEAPPMLRLALHRCVHDLPAPPRSRLRRT